MSPPHRDDPRTGLPTAHVRFRQLGSHPLAPWLLALLVALVLGSGLLRCGSCLGIGDWDYFTARALVSRRALIEFGQLPTWDPYHCGGMSIAGNFQSRTYTPSFLLVLALGPIWGVRAFAIVLLALGFEGSRRLATALGAGRWGALFAAFAIVGNGHVALHLAAGHLSLLTFLLAPFLMLALLRAAADPWRGVLGGAPWAALALVEGGLQPLLYTYSMCALLGAVEAWRTRRLGPLLGVVGSGVFALGLAAIVLVPVLSDSPLLQRVPGAEAPTPLEALWPVLFGLEQSPGHAVRFAGQRWLWHEYGAYVGPLFPLLVVFGSYRAGGRAYVLLAAGLLAALLALGDHGPFSPGAWVRQLPVFGATRVPMRLLVIALLCWSLAGALGLDRKPRFARAGVLLFALNLALVFVPISFAALGPPQDLRTHPERPFRQFASPAQMDAVRAFAPGTNTLDVLRNRSNLMCYEPVRGPPAVRLLPEDSGELELLAPEGPATGSARMTYFSPGRVEVEVAGSSGPTMLIVNQNFGSGWERTDGEPVVSMRGRIATMVTAEMGRVVFVHRPMPLYIGAIVTLASGLALRLLSRHRARRAMYPEPQHE